MVPRKCDPPGSRGEGGKLGDLRNGFVACEMPEAHPSGKIITGQ